jgi:hypothetical protein
MKKRRRKEKTSALAPKIPRPDHALGAERNEEPGETAGNEACFGITESWGRALSIIYMTFGNTNPGESRTTNSMKTIKQRLNSQTRKIFGNWPDFLVMPRWISVHSCTSGRSSGR